MNIRNFTALTFAALLAATATTQAAEMDHQGHDKNAATMEQQQQRSDSASDDSPVTPQTQRHEGMPDNTNKSGDDLSR